MEKVPCICLKSRPSLLDQNSILFIFRYMYVIVHVQICNYNVWQFFPFYQEKLSHVLLIGLSQAKSSLSFFI